MQDKLIRVFLYHALAVDHACEHEVLLHVPPKTVPGYDTSVADGGKFQETVMGIDVNRRDAGGRCIDIPASGYSLVADKACTAQVLFKFYKIRYTVAVDILHEETWGVQIQRAIHSIIIELSVAFGLVGFPVIFAIIFILWRDEQVSHSVTVQFCQHELAVVQRALGQAGIGTQP